MVLEQKRPEGRRWQARGRGQVVLGQGLRGAALALLVASALGCQEKPKTGAIRAEALGPVPAPAGLAAELVLAHPNASWGRVREMVGGPLKFLPASYPMLVSSALGLPPLAADQIDADVPTLGAVTSDGKQEVPVVAVHVKDGNQMLQVLTAGPDARYTAKPDGPSGVTLLEPKPGQSALNASLGLTGNYLLVGYAPDGLLKVGPYAARTLSTKPTPKEDAVLVSGHDALAGPLRTRLSVWWGETRRSLEKSDQEQRERHGGSAPSFGDPKAALQKADTTFQGIFALMTDLSEGRITLSLDDAGAHLKTTFTPQSADGSAGREFAAMKTGDASLMLDLPASSTMALMTSDSAEIREHSAADQGEALEKVLAGKLEEGDRKRLRDVLASWSKGRGDWLVLGGHATAAERVLFARSSIADADALDKGIRATFDLTKVPALAEPLKHWLGEIKLSPVTPLEGSPRGALVKAERLVPMADFDPATGKIKRHEKGDDKGKGDKAKDEKAKDDGKKGDKAKEDGKKGDKGKGTEGRTETFELAWSLDKDIATYVLNRDAKAALAEYAPGASGGSLRADEEIKNMVSSLGNEASFALLILPMRFVAGMMPKAPPTRPPSAPLVIAFGKGAQGGWFRLDAAPAAVRELAKIRPMD